LARPRRRPEAFALPQSDAGVIAAEKEEFEQQLPSPKSRSQMGGCRPKEAEFFDKSLWGYLH